MNYQEATQYLYDTLPMFQRIGNPAFKKDLGNTLALCKHLGEPQRSFPSVHIAGTNGKGSSAHSIAAILQGAGYKTGLYTSPHLKEFTERIRVNGAPIAQQSVINFVENHRAFLDELKPSFFETTVAMAFDYFSQEQVDIAVIEVGMGGRFDSTNVIQPLVSLITHIGLDHVAFLGDTLEKIAFEKAGIIKDSTPVVIGERQPETTAVFEKIAGEKQAPLYFAQESYHVEMTSIEDGRYKVNVDKDQKRLFEAMYLSLGAHYQLKNLPGILRTIDVLRTLGYHMSPTQVESALGKVSALTGLKGRWQILQKNPLIICDTGHNKGAFEEIGLQLSHLEYNQLYAVIGMNEEKEPETLLSLLPKDTYFIFCQADLPRAMPVELLSQKAGETGILGESVKEVNAAYQRAKALAGPDDCIFVGGSTFVVAEIEDLS